MDDNGNLTSNGSTSFGYDTENRLTSASGAKNVALTYDPLGRLYQVTSAGATTRFLYDDDRLIAEYNTSRCAYGVTTVPSNWRFQYTGRAAIPQPGLD